MLYIEDKTVARQIAEEVIVKLGTSKIIHSDQGKHFEW